MAEKLGWGILGTGAIAKAFAQGVAQSKTGTLVAVGSRSQESADRFAVQFKVPLRHASYQGLLVDEMVDAI
jgi:predicted dehydrogenase